MDIRKLLEEAPDGVRADVTGRIQVDREDR